MAYTHTILYIRKMYAENTFVVKPDFYILFKETRIVFRGFKIPVYYNVTDCRHYPKMTIFGSIQYFSVLILGKIK